MRKDYLGDYIRTPNSKVGAINGKWLRRRQIITEEAKKIPGGLYWNAVRDLIKKHETQAKNKIAKIYTAGEQFLVLSKPYQLYYELAKFRMFSIENCTWLQVLVLTNDRPHLRTVLLAMPQNSVPTLDCIITFGRPVFLRKNIRITDEQWNALIWFYQLEREFLESRPEVDIEVIRFLKKREKNAQELRSKWDGIAE